MEKFKHILFLALLLYTVSMSATGPSYINVRMTPIARNGSGDVLCRTSLEKNSTGGYYLNRIDYGLCVISQDSIIEYPLVFELKGDEVYENQSMQVFEEYYDQWQSWVMGKSRDLTDAEKKLVEEYEFKELIANEYLRNDTISLTNFTDKYLTEDNQKLKSLSNGKADLTELPLYSDKIVVTYDFGNIVFTLNQSECDDQDSNFGYEFNYVNPIFGGMEYEMYRITGVLFVR